MRIQYASDLHLETTPNEPFSTILAPSAPLLVIAGDICPVDNPLYAEFLRWCSQNWKYVIIIAGNHEYFCSHVPRTIPEINKEIKNLEHRFENMVFLQAGDSFVLEEIRFVGATLWSKVDSGIWNSPELLQKGDYTHTGVPPGRHSTPADIVALHTLHKSRLESVIVASKEPVVVITHHMPTYHLVAPEFKHHPFLSTYVSDLEYMMTPNVIAWICGHAHTSEQWTAPSGTQFVMNPRGYMGKNKRFYNTAVLEISPIHKSHLKN